MKSLVRPVVFEQPPIAPDAKRVRVEHEAALAVRLGNHRRAAELLATLDKGVNK